ncbi:MAG TPA: hypothetical protein IGS37_02695 [Synechococcales cyanobacterium M55_K2018_004]|nr:hypothetical protein [Synechococcales cyanobacterium M55_K2018_004]
MFKARYTMGNAPQTMLLWGDRQQNWQQLSLSEPMKHGNSMLHLPHCHRCSDHCSLNQ